MNINTIKEKIVLHKYYLIVITIMLVVIIIMLFLLFRESNDYVNPYEISYDANDNFLFLGDSITEYYHLEEYYDEIPVVNSGVSGNVTTDILDNMKERVYQYNPTKVFLLIGTNDLERYSDEDDVIDNTFNNIEKIVTEIRENRSNAVIYVESLYPINSVMDDSVAGNRTNDKIEELNKKIEDYCDGDVCTYINMYDSLLDDDGNLKEDYTADGLHLNSLGYVVVTRCLLPYLNE